MPESKKIPVTLVCGFLGAGKTTLINHLLKNNQGKRIALIENEFGELGIDNELVENIDDLLIEMNNGCLCCNVRGDMIEILEKMLDSSKEFDYILIEATGVANPGPVLEAFLGDSPLKKYYEINNVVCVGDASHFQSNVNEAKERTSNEFENQIAFSNMILINKLDQSNASEVDRFRSYIKNLNQDAEIHEVINSNIDSCLILNRNLYSLERLESIEVSNDDHHHHHHDHSQDHDHDHHNYDHAHDINTVAVEVEGELEPELFEFFLNYTLFQYGDRLYRAKGIIYFKKVNKKTLFQGVYSTFDFEHGGDHVSGAKKVNKIVFIGRNLNRDALTKGFKNCLVKT